MKTILTLIFLLTVSLSKGQNIIIDSTDVRSISNTFIDAGHQMGKFTTCQIASLCITFGGVVVLSDIKSRNSSIGTFMIIGGGALHLFSYSFISGAGTTLQVEGNRLKLKYKF